VAAEGLVRLLRAAALLENRRDVAAVSRLAALVGQNNPKDRNIYGGLFLTRIDWGETSWSPDEILGQIMITRLTPGAHGKVHFSMIGLTQNRKKIAELLRDGL
jgi:hypothetical protein